MTTRNGLAAEHAARETVTAALDRAVAAHLAEGGCAGQLGVMTGQALARPGAAAPPVPVAFPPRTGPVMRCRESAAVVIWSRADAGPRERT